MPQCPICNAAIWIGQRYCSTCQNYLPNPEEEDHFCPQCGIQVAPKQEICPKCNARLVAMAGTPAVTASFWKRQHRVLIFLATGLAIVTLLWLALGHQKPGPPKLLVEPPPQSGYEQTSAASIPTAETAPSAPAAQEPPGPSVPTTPSPPELTPQTPPSSRYVVKINYLALRDGPSMSAPQIATLNFHDEMELLETSGRWGRVRDVQRNIVGWASMKYLQPAAADGPRTVP